MVVLTLAVGPTISQRRNLWLDPQTLVTSTPQMIQNQATMKAARIHSFGGPEVIFIEDVPRPVTAAGEVPGHLGRLRATLT